MAHPALLILIVSGLVTMLLNGWGLLYKANLLIHPLLGIGFTVIMFYFAWRRFNRLGRAFAAKWWVGAPIVLSIVFAVPGIATPSAERFYALAAVLVAGLVIGLVRLSRALEVGEWFVAACNYTGFGLWVLSVHSGLSILTLSAGGGITHIVLYHRTVNLVFAGVFVSMIVLSLTGAFATSRAFPLEQPRIWASLRGVLSRGTAVREEQPRAWSALMLTALAAVVLAALVVMDRVSAVAAPSFTVPLSTIPIERRSGPDRATRFVDPAVAPAALDLTRSCGAARGCHEAIVQSFRESNHAISTTTAHMQRSFALLRTETGAHNTKICAGCHTPAALFDTGADEARFAHHENMSCSFCHMIRDVWIDTAPSLRSSYTLRPPLGHLRMFIENGVEKPPGFVDALLIRLSPVSHARQFSSPLLASDRFCDACHHQQIPSERGSRLLAKPRCIDCHMRPLDELGAAGSVRSHFMPGANVTVPFLAGREAAASLVTRWIDGHFPFAIPGWENRGWERLGGRAQATWLWMLFEAAQDAKPGNMYTLDILTANVGMGHRFPAAPLDLVTAWLEVQVHDADGRIVFEQGFADTAGHIPADAHRVGGQVLGDDGKPIEHYRVWQAQRDVIERVMEPGVPIRDRYTFRIPENVSGPLTLAAEWKYRKLNRDILDWAYGPDTNVPAVVVGSLAGVIPLAGSEVSARNVPLHGPQFTVDSSG